MNNTFKKEDKDKVIEFLNFIAKKAKFDDLSIQDSIDLVKLLTFMQQTLLTKIDSNILEVVRVVEPKKEETSTTQVEPKKQSRSKK